MNSLRFGVEVSDLPEHACAAHGLRHWLHHAGASHLLADMSQNTGCDVIDQLRQPAELQVHIT